MTVELVRCEPCLLEYSVRCSKFVDLSAPGRKTRSVAAELWVAYAATGAGTVLKKVRWVNGGSGCWINLQANPTSLLIGTNAVAVALGPEAEVELLNLSRYPFLPLGRILRAVDGEFAWSKATRRRLRQGEIALHNVQLAAYLPLGSRRLLRRFLCWLDAVYCARVVLPGWCSLPLGRELKLHARSCADGADRLTGVMFMRRERSDGRAITTVNFYDKLATLTDEERELLDSAVVDFLQAHLRVDATLHRPLLRRLARAARIGRADTAAHLCRAIAALDARATHGKSLGFDGWLRHQAFIHYLRLPSVLRFRPEDVVEARTELTPRHPNLEAVWDQWIGIKPAVDAEGRRRKRPTLRVLLRGRGVPEGTIGTLLRAVHAAGLDPTIPPAFFHRLAMLSSLWGLDDAEVARFARARVTGDWPTLRALLRRNRDFLAATREWLEPLAAALLRPLPVPALGPAAARERT